jgi:hypothetical protein
VIRQHPEASIEFKRQVKDDATADELRAEMMKRIAAMRDAGLIDLTVLPPLNGGTGNRPPRGVDPSGLNGG